MKIRRMVKAGVWYAAMLLLCLCAGCKKQQEDDVPMLFAATNGNIDMPVLGTYAAQAAGISAAFPFLSAEYCVPDIVSGTAGNNIQAKAAFLFDITGQEVLYAQGCFDKIYPASTTKLLTALTLYRILEEGGYSLADQVSIQETNGGITAYGAKLCGLKKGESTSLSGLLNALMVYSANDAGIAIAQHLCGGVDAFVARMNEVAREIGATHTHFTNPHGLHDREHYTTAYDMYLIFRECIRYDGFIDMVGQDLYTLEYVDTDGIMQQMELESTNQYFLGTYETPNGVLVAGGKTGSTPSAGDCLVLLSSHGGSQYISAVFGADSRDNLYGEMAKLLAMELADTAR